MPSNPHQHSTKATIASSSPPPGTATQPNKFGKLAVERGFITQAQLDEALKMQLEAARVGLPRRLGDILISKQYLSEDQLREVLRDQTMTKKVGQYELISKLGEGGMGSVFKARQMYADRLIALKILSPKNARQQEFRDRFVREARAVARLNHPHIIGGIDVGTADGYCYFAMEFVDGPTLAQHIHDNGRLSEPEALEFARQTALALHHAHENAMLHRDVKPDNLLYDTQRKIVKLADLGLVRSAESAADDAALYAAGQAIGTPFYMSPEQARGQTDLTPASDLYSLGATLFYLLTSRAPYDGASAAEIMDRHIKDPVPSPRTHLPELALESERLVMKMMNKQPRDRFTSGQAVAEEITRIQALLLSRSTGPLPALKSKRERSEGSSKGWVIGAAIAGALAVGAICLYQARKADPSAAKAPAENGQPAQPQINPNAR